jgi:hypothetical protein
MAVQEISWAATAYRRGGLLMGAVMVGVAGTLLGVLFGGVLQQVQASRIRRWQREDWLRDAKSAAYAEYLRSISASYVQAMSGVRTRSEDYSLYAATARIEVLCGAAIAGPARQLADTAIDVHSRIAAGAGLPQQEVAGVDRRRRELIARFKADLRLAPDAPANG